MTQTPGSLKQWNLFKKGVRTFLSIIFNLICADFYMCGKILFPPKSSPASSPSWLLSHLCHLSSSPSAAPPQALPPPSLLILAWPRSAVLLLPASPPLSTHLPVIWPGQISYRLNARPTPRRDQIRQRFACANVNARKYCRGRRTQVFSFSGSSDANVEGNCINVNKSNEITGRYTEWKYSSWGSY